MRCDVGDAVPAVEESKSVEVEVEEDIDLKQTAVLNRNGNTTSNSGT